MTRWKKEFQAWILREGLIAWVTPKKPGDWRVAQHLSRMADHTLRKPEVQEEIERAMAAAIFGCQGAKPSPLDRFLK